MQGVAANIASNFEDNISRKRIYATAEKNTDVVNKNFFKKCMYLNVLRDAMEVVRAHSLFPTKKSNLAETSPQVDALYRHVIEEDNHRAEVGERILSVMRNNGSFNVEQSVERHVLMRQIDLPGSTVTPQSFIGFFLVAVGINIAEHVLAKGSRKNLHNLFPHGDLWSPTKTEADRIHKLDNIILRKEATGNDSWEEYKVERLKDLRCDASECNIHRIAFASFKIENKTLADTSKYKAIAASLLDPDKSLNLLHFSEEEKKARSKKRKTSPEKTAENSSSKKNKPKDDEANAKAGSRGNESDELEKAILLAERSATIRQLTNEERAAAASGSPTVYTSKTGRKSIPVRPFVSESGVKAVPASTLSSSRGRKPGRAGRQVMALVATETMKNEIEPPSPSESLSVWSQMMNNPNEEERQKLLVRLYNLYENNRNPVNNFTSLKKNIEVQIIMEEERKNEDLEPPPSISKNKADSLLKSAFGLCDSDYDKHKAQPHIDEVHFALGLSNSSDVDPSNPAHSKEFIFFELTLGENVELWKHAKENTNPESLIVSTLLGQLRVLRHKGWVVSTFTNEYEPRSGLVVITTAQKYRYLKNSMKLPSSSKPSANVDDGSSDNDGNTKIDEDENDQNNRQFQGSLRDQNNEDDSGNDSNDEEDGDNEGETSQNVLKSAKNLRTRSRDGATKDGSSKKK